MNIELVAAGTKPPAWLVDGYDEYVKRLPRDWQFDLREVAVAKRSRSTNIARLKQQEGERILAAIKPNARIIALDSDGEIWSTEQLAAKMSQWRNDYPLVQLIVGGPDGLDDACLERADDVWSLSRLTFPHFIVRLMIVEQVYRAWSIVNNHPYHK
ncbi:MAG: 23S rRNA (pseudouridine(1915)-N(3))-methyltransferase RlmH [Pseudomonadales bacterium]